ncbi:MAG: tRNA (N6-isopentenyl adenosine(37)-C2)-methylthiotransferase MiaB [Desulfotomaculaceae bacterium]|nr:tRNA (N6-isopentenyl adenosine(37)-C2)-methylthiotransferase MiaB [Desulfotomaculaceae bacterium]
MKSYIIKTFGCQMNEHDSEVLAGMLEAVGYRSTEDTSTADLVLLNTCCIRETAENKVFSYLGRLKRQKLSNPAMIIGVCGCMPQQEGMAARLRQLFPYVDLVFGTHNVQQLPVFIGRILAERKPVVEILTEPAEIIEGLPAVRKEGLRAWVTIMHGCDNYCTYCIVPYVRGRERSRKPDDIIREMPGLGSEGFKEVVLLGQNVNSYGKDLTPPLDFAGLLEKLDGVSSIERIRYMTSHPRDFNEKLILTIARLGKVCEHFHLPVQSGSSRILEKMHRGYTREHYLGLIEKIRLHIPKATITTDIMVGFPGEENDDFRATMDLVSQVRFDSSYTFVYNARPGTPAAGMAEQVPEEIKKQRIQALIKLQNTISLENNKAEEGSWQEVLVEGERNNASGLVYGKSRGYKTVVFPGDKTLIGSTAHVTITRAHLAYLEGSLKN